MHYLFARGFCLRSFHLFSAAFIPSLSCLLSLRVFVADFLRDSILLLVCLPSCHVFAAVFCWLPPLRFFFASPPSTSSLIACFASLPRCCFPCVTCVLLCRGSASLAIFWSLRFLTPSSKALRLPGKKYKPPHLSRNESTSCHKIQLSRTFARLSKIAWDSARVISFFFDRCYRLAKTSQLVRQGHRKRLHACAAFGKKQLEGRSQGLAKLRFAHLVHRFRRTCWKAIPR